MQTKSPFRPTLAFLIPALAFLFPLFYFPAATNFFQTPKMLLLVAATSVVALAWGTTCLLGKSIIWSKTRLVVPLILFVGTLLLSLYATVEGRTEALLGPAALYICVSILAYFLSSTHDEKLADRVVGATIASTTLLAIHSLLQLTVLYRLTMLPAYMQNRAFTPTGAPLTTVTLMVIGLALSVTLLSKMKDLATRLFLGTTTILQIITIVAYVALMLPGQPLALAILPYSASWSILLDGAKYVRIAVLGAGLGNFALLYTKIKPLFLNTTPLWNVVPQTATSELFNLVSTAGVLGGAAFVFLMSAGLRTVKKAYQNHAGITTIFVTSLLALVLTPASLPVVFLTFISLALVAGGEEAVRPLAARPAPYAIAAGTLLAVVVAGYYFTLYAMAEYHLYRAQIALAAHDGGTVYQESLDAVKLVPTMASYHFSYSQVNLSLAAALSQKGSLSDQDRTNISQLVSQAVNEAKLTTTLVPDSSQAWENLGTLYQNLINVAGGADQFAIQSYAQAVSLDPGNPTLRVEFGGLFYELGQTATDSATKTTNLNRAVQEFQTAVQLKPDFANGYYNLGKAYEAQGDYPDAYAAMQQTVANLSTTSTDYQTATAELATIQNKLPKATVTPSPSPSPSPKQLTTPSPLPSPLPGGPIILPAASSSPTSSATPVPTPAPSAKP